MARNKRKAQQYAREVSEAMMRLRGWDPEDAPEEVVSDVFGTLVRHEEFYVQAYRDGVDPEDVAQSIQNADWELSNEQREQGAPAYNPPRTSNPDESEHAAIGLIHKLDSLRLIRRLKF